MDGKTEYFFILTMQRPVPGPGTEVATVSSTSVFKAGTTRGEAFAFLMGYFRNRLGWRPDEGSVLFFSLESNIL